MTNDLTATAEQIRDWAHELGFQAVGITDTELEETGQRLNQWLDRGLNADLSYMAQHGEKRYRPAQLVEGTERIIAVRLDYRPEPDAPDAVLADDEKAYITRYSLGRDYHKLMRKRLAKLAKWIDEALPGYYHRAFVDSAPVMEKPIAVKAGLGWQGKHTLLLHPQAGSWFFLGEIYTSAPLPVDEPWTTDHCGSCTACLDVCPTNAFPEPYVLDAARCISYLTIENNGPIPEELRPLMGNRVFGCDDCQLVCPFNKFSESTEEPDFQPRHGLDNSTLAELFLWDEATFLKRTEGSAIRRAGYEGWLRNLAVGLGNAPSTIPVIEALRAREDCPSELVREHVQWALRRHGIVQV
ncbi:tRNA epoxyqueuosine(34) reductase QueG [Halospina sp. K52047b]|uniref:tRNA epoxyqueuosine(34) reductase QueG n=1 Tax=Halospina sp. K52047b TaxID=2614160 RepID=UPI00124AA3A5|nr:tRNA epoxyqueuosine(34) reductase QueG [Halospina sp. K52047b]KAA8979718.1 tRNA epoxyqueuosine(34) reductase QueG [Halospina sp. K52047b]